MLRFRSLLHRALYGKSQYLSQQFRRQHKNVASSETCIHNIVIAKHANVYLGAQSVIIIIIINLPPPPLCFSTCSHQTSSRRQIKKNGPRKTPFRMLSNPPNFSICSQKKFLTSPQDQESITKETSPLHFHRHTLPPLPRKQNLTSHPQQPPQTQPSFQRVAA